MATLVACSGDGTTDSQSPHNEFDAAKVSANVATIGRIAATPILDSWSALGDYLGPAARQSPGVETRVEGGQALLINSIRRIVALTGAGRGAFLVPVVRPAVYGRTYIYSPETGQYAVDPARTGAPANGVRFILYETDDNGAIMPAVEIGHADLIDEKAGSPNSAGLRFKVVSSTTTVLDYSFELGGLFVNPTLEVSGYLSDGTDRVNFEISTSAPAWATGGTARLDATLDLVGKDFKVTTSLEANAGATDGSGEVAVKIEGGDDIIEIDSETASGQVDVTVKVNGAVFATATGPAGNPVIKGEGGRDLTQDEWAALAQLVEFTNGVFGLLGGLLAPAGALLALALGLT